MTKCTVSDPPTPYSRLKINSVVITAVAHASNPIIPAPAIDYNYKILLNPGANNISEPEVSLTGAHDGFPAYSVQVKNIDTGTTYQMHSYTPKSNLEIIKLLPIPGTEVNVNSNTMTGK